MPAVIVQQYGGARAFTFWDSLALGLSNEAAPLQFVVVSHGLLSIIGLAAFAAPFAAPFVRHPRAKFLYAMPLLYLILVGVAFAYDCSHALGEAVDTAKRGVTYDPGNPAWNRQQQLALQGIEGRLEQFLLNSFSIGYGAFVIALASLIVAARALKRPASNNAGNLARPPGNRAVSPESGSCTNCGRARIAGARFCTNCGAQHASAAVV
jgi:hypothetical protein